MQAVQEQSTILPVAGTHPGVTYDEERAVIVATVFASLPPSAQEPLITAPVIAIPRTPSDAQHWTLFWVLMHDQTIDSASFGDNGIAFSGSMAVGVTMTDPVQVSPTQWSVEIVNQAKLLSAFSYTIEVTATGRTITHDPTIVVTPEPMGGVG